MRVFLTLAVAVSTFYWRTRAELPGWVEAMRGRHIRELRQR